MNERNKFAFHTIQSALTIYSCFYSSSKSKLKIKPNSYYGIAPFERDQLIIEYLLTLHSSASNYSIISICSAESPIQLLIHKHKQDVTIQCQPPLRYLLNHEIRALDSKRFS